MQGPVPCVLKPPDGRVKAPSISISAQFKVAYVAGFGCMESAAAIALHPNARQRLDEGRLLQCTQCRVLVESTSHNSSAGHTHRTATGFNGGRMRPINVDPCHQATNECRACVKKCTFAQSYVHARTRAHARTQRGCGLWFCYAHERPST